MPNLTRTGRVLLAVATTAFGILCLVYGDFVSGLQPVAEWVSPRWLWASLTGLVLIASGIGLLIDRITRAAALALATIFGAWALVLYLPRLVVSPHLFGSAWVGCFENLALGGGVLALSGAAWTLRTSPRRWDRAVDRADWLGRMCFGIALPVFGMSHFVHADFVATLVPAWIPGKLFWAWFTGAAHFAAGVAILGGILARPAALLHATMVGTWVVILHVPRVAADVGNRAEWTSLFVAVAMCGAALVIAGLFSTRTLRTLS